MRPSFGISTRTWLAAGLLLGLAGCSSDSSFQASANVAGNYTVAVTYGADGCKIGTTDWVPGKSVSDIPFLVEQQDKNLSGTLQGLPALGLLAVIGTNKFQGTATGNDFDITAFGTVMHSQGNCMYELNAEISGSISGDAISGSIKYAPATNSNPDCASVQCSSTQDFNGTRPPS